MKYFTWLKRDEIVVSKKELKELITADRDAHAAEERAYIVQQTIKKTFTTYVETKRMQRLNNGHWNADDILKELEANLKLTEKRWLEDRQHFYDKNFEKELRDKAKHAVQGYAYDMTEGAAEALLSKSEFVTKLAKKLNDLQLKVGN